MADAVPVVRLIGAPTDIHSSFLRGPALAPPAIRAALASDHGNVFAESGVEIGVEVVLRDVGDLPLTESPGDDALIEATVAQAAREGDMPLVLGGDHAISLPIVKALAGIHGALDILHFDAHPDLYDDFGGDPRSHASPFARIMEGGYARRLVQIGIRTLHRHCREQAERFGVEIVEMRHFRRETVPRLDGPLYVSIDMDGFDPAFAPGVSHHEPGGLTVRDVVGVIADIGRPLIGADIVEFNPARDVNGVTAVLCAKLVRELTALQVL